jgi:hypothetical protein
MPNLDPHVNGRPRLQEPGSLSPGLESLWLGLAKLARAAADLLRRLGEPDTSGAAGGLPVPRGPHLTKLDRQILQAAKPEYQSKRQLADACDNHDEDSYFAGRVRHLRRLGLLDTDGQGGYRLPVSAAPAVEGGNP